MAGNAVKRIRVTGVMDVVGDATPYSKRVLKACSVALRIMHATGSRTIFDVPVELPDTLRVPQEYLDLMEGVPHVALLRAPVGKPVQPGAIVSICTTCERWAILSGTGRPPTAKVKANGGPARVKCNLTLDCDGMRTKVYMAPVADPKRDDEPDETETPDIVDVDPLEDVAEPDVDGPAREDEADDED